MSEQIKNTFLILISRNSTKTELHYFTTACPVTTYFFSLSRTASTLYSTTSTLRPLLLFPFLVRITSVRYLRATARSSATHLPYATLLDKYSCIAYVYP